MVAAAVRIAGARLGGKDKSQFAKLVSARLNVTPAAVYKWIEQGHMRRAALETVLELSELSGVDVKELAAQPEARVSKK